MYVLDNPYYLYLMLAIPLLALLYIYYYTWRRNARKRFGDMVMLENMAPDRTKAKPVIKLILYMLILASLAIALVNPKVGSKLETVKREGVDIVFALDVSKSMLAEDVRPNRMEKAKQIISSTLNELVSDRTGIIIYAASAYPQLPITTDYNAARLFLRTINTDIIPSQGTAIAEAIELATNYFDDDEQTNRLLILISDGEDHESGYKDVIKEARENGIRIYTIGVGTTKGAPIPAARRGSHTDYKRDRNNEVVISRLNEDVLKEIAELGGGDYIQGNSSVQVARYLSETIADMEKKEFETQVFADYEDQFQWFLGFALLMMFIDVLILERKTQWFKKLNLFNDEVERS